VLLVVACGSGGEWTAPPPPVAAVTIKPESVEVVVRGTVQLTATTWDASGRAVHGRAVTWASSNRAVGMVSATGLVTALIRGSTTITVTCGGERGTAVVVVFVPMGV
jgi:uncharacterized protein YjdB